MKIAVELFQQLLSSGSGRNGRNDFSGRNEGDNEEAEIMAHYAENVKKHARWSLKN